MTNTEEIKPTLDRVGPTGKPPVVQKENVLDAICKEIEKRRVRIKPSSFKDTKGSE